jgi:hypothetical protein
MAQMVEIMTSHLARQKSEMHDDELWTMMRGEGRSSGTAAAPYFAQR